MREDIKRLQIIELQLKDAIQNLYQQRDALIMELQQLQEAKPVLEKAYAVRTIASANIRRTLLIIAIVFLYTAFISPKFDATNTAIGNEKS